jgi:hypothetical protein
MGKRASSQTTANKAKVARAAISSSDAAALPWQPELELLKLAELPASCQQMLKAMMPHCLGTAEFERHEAQKAVAGIFDKIFAGLQSDKQSAVTMAQEALQRSEAELAPFASKVEAAQKEFDQKAAEASEADTAQQSGPTTKVVSEAKAALQAAKDHQGGLSGERDAAESRRAEIAEKLANIWKPLREGTVKPASKMQKELKVISALLKQCGAEESFLAGLPAALRGDAMTGVTASAFGAKLLQYADELLQRKIQHCTDVIDGFEGRTTEAAQSVVSAEAKLAEAVVAHDVVVDAHIAAQNRLAKAQEQLSDAKDQAMSSQLKVSEARAAFGADEDALKAIQELIAARVRLDPIEKAATPEVAPDAE